ncbi:MAG: hypothetical protein WC865_17520 [Bacteroidales bacterium]
MKKLWPKLTKRHYNFNDEFIQEMYKMADLTILPKIDRYGKN